MQCVKCGFSNPEEMKFCGFCAAALDHICPQCHFINPASFVFCGQCAHKLPTKPFPTRQFRQISKNAERRQLTVLFCDIVNSSAISSKIDPEDLREIIKGYRNTCSEVVARHGGHIAQHLGDGVLVYFGHPVAHEDDAQRAARSGLEIIEHIKNDKHALADGSQLQLSVRIGIHTGLVVIGEIGNDKRTLALGDTPNIASRIQDKAEPDTLLVSDTTLTLLKGEFNTNPIGKLPLKGFTNLFEVYQVLSIDCKHRKQVIAARTLSHIPLFGRNKETEILQEKIKLARNGASQFVFLRGESGLGKTRLVEYVFEKIQPDSVIVLECSGSNYYKNSFFHPVIEMLKDIIALNSNTDDTDNLRRLEKTFNKYSLSSDISIRCLNDLLSNYYSGEHDVISESTPQQKKQLIMYSVLELVQSIAKQNFVVLVADDLQWIDPSTLEFLALLANKSGLTNIFALYTTRNEFPVTLSKLPNLTLITLNHLTHNQSGKMIHSLCNSKALPDEIFSEIINKTDGIPIYIEELTNAILRSSILREMDDHYKLTSPIGSIGIPSTLHDSLMSRLDSLGEDKELAQICSILGRDFSHELLSAISSYDQSHLQNSLERLINAGFFFRYGLPPRSRYSFRHALLHETAYQSLLIKTRRKYHQLIASIIKKRFQYIIHANPEIMAHHCIEADKINESIEYWFAAGRKAGAQSANIEAISHYTSGLSALDKLPDSEDKMTWELKLQTNLGTAISCCKGYADPEVENAYARARALCNNIKDTKAIFPVLCGLWEFYIVRANHHAALNLAKKLMDIALDTKIPEFLIEAQRINGTTHFWRGQLNDALLHFDAINNFNANRETITLSSDYCQNTRVAKLANSSCAYWLTGKPDQALETAIAALTVATELSHPFSRAYALQFLATVYQLRGNHTETARIAEDLIILSKTYKFPFWEATGKMMQTWANSNNENINQCLEEFQNAMEAYNASGNRLARSYFDSLYAELLIKSGSIGKAITIIDKSITATDSSNEKYFLAELLRIKGEILSMDENKITGNKAVLSEAEDYLIRALEFSKQQDAKSLTLRIVISISKLTDLTTLKLITLNEIVSLFSYLLEEITEGKNTKHLSYAKNIYSRLKHQLPSK